MPGPSYIVTLTDKNGREWEVRVWGSCDTEFQIQRYAALEARRLEKEEPTWFAPAWPVEMTKIELWNDAQIEGPVNVEVVS